MKRERQTGRQRGGESQRQKQTGRDKTRDKSK